MKKLFTVPFLLMLFFCLIPNYSFSQKKMKAKNIVDEALTIQKVVQGDKIIENRLVIKPTFLNNTEIGKTPEILTYSTSAALINKKREENSYQGTMHALFQSEKVIKNFKKTSVANDGPKAIKTSTGNTNWNNANTWSPSGVPSSGDVVIINHNVNINTAGVCNMITINSGKILTINSTWSLSVGTGGIINTGSVVLSAGNTTYTTYLIIAGNINNIGTINGTALYTTVYFNGTTEQTFTNNGSVTAPLACFSLANNAGLTLSGANQIIAGRVNLFYGTTKNSDKITLGIGGSTTAAIQIGGNVSYTAGNFDKSPQFNSGTGGIQLIYAPAQNNYYTAYEVPPDGTVAYLLLVCSPRTLTLSRDITIPYIWTTSLDLSGGNLNIGSHTFTVDGVIGVTSGTLSGSTSSNLTLSGSVATTLPAISGGLNNLTVNNNNGAKLAGQVTINGTLFLTNGYLINGSNLTMANASTISRSAGSLTSLPVFAGTVNLIYSGGSSILTSKELPTGASVINNFIINSGGTVQNSAFTESVSTLYAQGFNDVTTASDWGTTIMNDPVVNTPPKAYIVNNGNHPNVLPSEGAGCIEFNSYFCDPGDQVLLWKYSSPLATTGKTNITIVFDWYMDNIYTNADNVMVVWSDGTIWNSSSSYYRYSATSGWVTLNCLLPSEAENLSTLYVGLLFTSEYGNNCHLDNFKVNVTTPGTPTASTCTINGTLYLTGNYTIGSGNTLNMATNSIINRSDGSLSAAPLFGSSVNLIYSGTNAVITGFEIPATASVLNNYTVNKSGGVTLNSDVTVNGSFTPATGILTLGNYTLTLAGTVGTIGTGSITCAGTSVVILSGPETIPNNLFSGNEVQNLTINRSGVVNLGCALTAKGTLTLNNGKLMLGANNLILGSSSTIAGTPSASNMIVATGTGELRKTFSGAGSFTYPVGDNDGTAEYSPVTLNFSTGTFSSAYAGVRLVNDKHPNNGSTASYINRYWTINQSGISAFSCGLILEYVPEDVQGTLHNEEDLWGAKWNGTNWILLNPTDFALHHLTGTVTSFSSFTGGQQGALPVDIASFTSNVVGRNTILKWVTSSEIQNEGFDVERKLLNTQWMKIGYVPGNGNVSSSYFYEDRNLQSGKYLYRLKQIDVDGNIKYHNLNGEVEIGVPGKFELSQNYPNPFNSSTKIDFDLPSESKVSILLYDMTGRELKKFVQSDLKSGYYTEILNLSSQSSGIYFYRIIAQSSGNIYISTKKMIFVK